MEQSNGPIQQPLRAASADPAFVPGITAVSAPPEDARPAAAADTDTDTADDMAGAGAETAPGAERTADADTEDTAEAGAGAEDAPRDAEPADGPVFEAADRRGRIVADAEGVRLSYDEEACEFRWDELAAVESEKARFGKRFTVTVHTPDRRWYPIDLQAPDRARVTAWESELDAVLDAYFDESA
ncbi:hypothetical protein GCM10010363_73380 [Streptomyces omiyaensis]|uniref:hypothetical protein n=1 Tax=Streptomyces omiyaensis TaxID=68247 RepID=UPI0016765DE7|nr:hypothetical protein [Streptomyces omiyaensis]GGY81939.1 hypothetical protein GCM10010363_73380 [Streptomyces omiyaensis]